MHTHVLYKCTNYNEIRCLKSIFIYVHCMVHTTLMLAGGASTSKGGVNIKGYLLSADDVLSMDEKERVALLERVKSGNMSIDEALQEVIEHQRRQNCNIM